MNFLKLIKKPFLDVIKNENASAMVYALIVVVMFSFIMVISGDLAVDDIHIFNSQKTYEENLNIIESSLGEGWHEIFLEMDKDKLEESSDDKLDWIITDSDWSGNEDDWYDPLSGRVLGDINGDGNDDFKVPDFVADDILEEIIKRGEKASEPLRMTLVGWQGGKGSLKATLPSRKDGKILVEYISPGHEYGMIRAEIGIHKKF